MNPSQSSLYSICSICYPSNDEIVSIMFKLATLIVQEYKEFKGQNRLIISDSFQTKSHKTQEAVDKLIRFVFVNHIQADCLCKHQIVYKFLQDKTKLKRKEISIICQSIYQFQAKRNYQLEVLSSQIKCFSKTIGEELNRKPQLPINNELVQEPMVKIEPSQNEIEQKPSESKKVEIFQQDNHNAVFVPMYIHTIHPIHFGSFYNPLN